MNKLLQLRKANFYQLWLRLMYFSLMLAWVLGLATLTLREVLPQ